MSRMKTGALRAAKLGNGNHLASGLALLAMGRIDEAMGRIDEAMGRIDEAMLRLMPRGLDAGNGNRSRPRSRYAPHQGKRECARRRQQIALGRLEVSRGKA